MEEKQHSRKYKRNFTLVFGAVCVALGVYCLVAAGEGRVVISRYVIDPNANLIGAFVLFTFSFLAFFSYWRS